MLKPLVYMELWIVGQQWLEWWGAALHALSLALLAWKILFFHYWVTSFLRKNLGGKGYYGVLEVRQCQGSLAHQWTTVKDHDCGL
mmetsp:Transcript_23482/g.40964  ORF Transcript_23482/g.40964 Transcript_23482/m.40964 type:complete len:85 (+) Transcript_23482:763-1017(+)